jgi:hypothetical protein
MSCTALPDQLGCKPRRGGVDCVLGSSVNADGAPYQSKERFEQMIRTQGDTGYQ